MFTYKLLVLIVLLPELLCKFIHPILMLLLMFFNSFGELVGQFNFPASITVRTFTDLDSTITLALMHFISAKYFLHL